MAKQKIRYTRSSVFFCERGHTYGMPNDQKCATTPQIGLFCDAITIYCPKSAEAISLQTQAQRICIFSGLIFLAAILGSCSPQKTTSPVPPPPLKITTVGIIPFFGSHGEYMANSFAVNLRKCGFTVLEGNKILKIITETGYQPGEIFNLPSSSLSQIGKKSGIKNILVGSVSSGEDSSSGYTNIRVSLRLIDSGKEKVIWTHHSQYWTKPLSKQGDAQRAAEQLANIFCNDFRVRN